MTFPNGGQRDENHPNRQVDRETYDAKTFPNLPPEALELLNQGGYEAFVNQYGPLKFPAKRGAF